MPGAGNPQAFNRYSYAGNNPVKYTDPTGHCPLCAVGALGGAIGGAIYGYGSQAINTLNNQGVEKDYGKALTTNIDPAFVVFTAGAGAVIGSGVGILAWGADVATGGAVMCALTAPCRDTVVDSAEEVIPRYIEKNGRLVTNIDNPEVKGLLDRAGKLGVQEQFKGITDRILNQTYIKGPNMDPVSKMFQGALNGNIPTSLPTGVSKENVLAYIELARRDIADGLDSKSLEDFGIDLHQQEFRLDMLLNLIDQNQ